MAFAEDYDARIRRLKGEKEQNDEVSDTTAAEQRSLAGKKLIQDSLVSHVQFEPVFLHRVFLRNLKLENQNL